MAVDTPRSVPTTGTTPSGTTGSRNNNSAPCRGGPTGSCGGGRSAGQYDGARTPMISVFKGNTKDMNGHVFQVHDERVDPQQFKKSMEALNEYAMKTLTNTQEWTSVEIR
jgi:hypothetical protein